MCGDCFREEEGVTLEVTVGLVWGPFIVSALIGLVFSLYVLKLSSKWIYSNPSRVGTWTGAFLQWLAIIVLTGIFYVIMILFISIFIMSGGSSS